MKVVTTEFEGLLVLEPDVFQDHRGFFMESFNKEWYHENNLVSNFVQDNQSHSIKNVIRGLHFQKPPHAQTKLVRALYGKVWDVVVDLRSNQSTFGKKFLIELSSENRKQLLIPKGFAHGFSVLSDFAVLFYKCDQYYHSESDAGVLFSDPTLHIDWKVELSDAIVSMKDKTMPNFDQLKKYF
jgi:dTDP-4-dehydrorhamnose 3,5-epimerase